MARAERDIINDFNTQFVDFMEQLHHLLPEDDDIKLYHRNIGQYIKANAMALIESYQEHILDETKPYETELLKPNPDENVFLNLDYGEAGDQMKISELKRNWCSFSSEQKDNIVAFLQVLTYYAREHKDLSK